ncbi:MAG: FAD-dependent oxidoreductase [Azospira oryzae]|jgi:phytoene dehydrogenase-like protein|nr:MAG: FAD-dependent oxidoreductase [Azospira oryzae]
MKSRRSFLRASALAAAGMMLPAASSCSKKDTIFKGTLSGPDAALGHRLRDGNLPALPAVTEKEKIVIVGGGIAGLSAARALSKKQFSFRLLELETQAGGNSRNGENTISKYPLGAHYLPIPSLHNTELIQFLQECNVITGFVNHLPVYNEYHLCFDPKERLYINHHWQDGLIPYDGVPRKEQLEIERFLARMNEYRHLIGKDGRMAFSIPVNESSQDADLLRLDTLSMRDFLNQHNFTSPHLHWYVNYCCADDFGSSIADTSAWAGIHYFASRKGQAFNAKSDDVLTWPEGNHWLVQQLKKDIQKAIHTSCLVYRIQPVDNHVEVDYFDASSNTTVRLIADHVIVASPQFINKHIVQAARAFDFNAFQYAPWMVSNLTLTNPLSAKRGEPMCWDNVIYGSDALGYVNAAHQITKSYADEKQVITYYKPLLGSDCAAQRVQAQRSEVNAWRELIVNDLKGAHANIHDVIENTEVWIWGHGMIRPHPGFIWGADRKNAQQTIGNKIFFAHTDLSGISVFEEGFYSGLKAANQLMTAYA